MNELEMLNPIYSQMIRERGTYPELEMWAAATIFEQLRYTWWPNLLNAGGLL